jgi:hypothetical protein
MAPMVNRLLGCLDRKHHDAFVKQFRIRMERAAMLASVPQAWRHTGRRCAGLWSAAIAGELCAPPSLK